MTVVSARRRPVVRTVRFFVTHPVTLILPVLVIVAAVAVAVALPRLSPNLGLSIGPGSQEPAATRDYLQGSASFDAARVWSSLSPTAQQRYAAQGGSEQLLQQQLQATKDGGTRLVDISFVGSHPLPNGSVVELYVVGIKSPGSSATRYVPYMFTLDPSGKIAQVQ